MPGETAPASRRQPAPDAGRGQSLGLVEESTVDWNGELDLDLSGNDAAARPPMQAVDISIDGLPAAESAPEPASGALLMDNMQLGFAYQMHTGEHWQKVRLAHVSGGRSFFIFTHGNRHQETVTMTARMLRKLCESGRMRAYERLLLERATAAPAQLAALSTPAEPPLAGQPARHRQRRARLAGRPRRGRRCRRPCRGPGWCARRAGPASRSRPAPPEVLHRDQTVVVQHRHHHVELAPAGPHEDGVGRVGAGASMPRARASAMAGAMCRPPRRRTGRPRRHAGSARHRDARRAMPMRRRPRR
jgi:hypothetical protein